MTLLGQSSSDTAINLGQLLKGNHEANVLKDLISSFMLPQESLIMSITLLDPGVRFFRGTRNFDLSAPQRNE